PPAPRPTRRGGRARAGGRHRGHRGPPRPRRVHSSHTQVSFRTPQRPEPPVTSRGSSTMRFNTLVLLPALAIGAVPASAQSRISADTALASLVAAERAFAAHSMDISTQGAFQAWLADNAVLYRPRAVRAHEYLRARPMPQSLVLGWEPVFADVTAAGDLGYTTGPWIASHRERRDVQPTFGEYVTLWRRQADGSWKAEVDAGIAHEADPVGPTGLEAPPAPKWRGSRSDAAGALRSLLAADSAFAADAQR